jgi:hypothetical protein
MSDGKSFLLVWRRTRMPARWVVSLHGPQGFAIDDLAIRHPNVKDRATATPAACSICF